MDPAGALGEVAEKLGLVLAAGAAAIALVAPRARLRASAMVTAAAVAAVVLVGHIWHNSQFRAISDRPALFAVLLVLGLLAVTLLAALFVRRPALLALLAVATVPFRVPIAAGGSTANLLVPLYLVVAGGVAAHAWRRLQRSDAAGPGARVRASSLEIALAAFISLYALQSLYSRDFGTALQQMVFFYVPFALLFVLLAEMRWSRTLLAACAAVLVGLALVFSGIGFFEYSHRELLWNPKVISSNQFESYFRVNSVFWDPNVYGRFLAIVMVTVAAAVLWNNRRRVAIAGAAVLAVLWGGLVLTFSQSSFVSLLAGLAVLAAMRWDARRTVATSALAAAAAALLVVGFQGALRLHLGSSSGLNKASSGRVDLIKGGLELFGNRPLWGYGSGAFARSYRLERKGNQRQAVSASHTLPITVAAEQGVLGLFFYACVLAASIMTLLGRVAAPRAPPWADGRDGAQAASEAAEYRAARAALTAAFATLVVHTMMYAAFLEDPLTWVILGVGLAVAPHAARLPSAPALRAPASRPAPTTA
jgi:putative inorganic carbon (HCO3(-)) transporter